MQPYSPNGSRVGVDEQPGHVRHGPHRTGIAERLPHDGLPAVRTDDEVRIHFHRVPAVGGDGNQAFAIHFRDTAAGQQSDAGVWLLSIFCNAPTSKWC